MADGNQPRDEAGRFARTKPKSEDRPHPCERLARTFNPPPELTKRAATDSGNRMRKRADYMGDDEFHYGTPDRIDFISAWRSLPDDTSWCHQFDDAMALGIACVATGLPSDLLLARWAGRDHRGLACRLLFERMVRMGFAKKRHATRIAVAWIVSQYLSPPPQSRAERPRTFREHVIPALSVREAAKRAHVGQASFRLLARLTRAALGDMMRELEQAYCTARFSGF